MMSSLLPLLLQAILRVNPVHYNYYDVKYSILFRMKTYCYGVLFPVAWFSFYQALFFHLSLRQSYPYMHYFTVQFVVFVTTKRICFPSTYFHSYHNNDDNIETTNKTLFSCPSCLPTVESKFVLASLHEYTYLRACLNNGSDLENLSIDI